MSHSQPRAGGLGAPRAGTCSGKSRRGAGAVVVASSGSRSPPLAHGRLQLPARQRCSLVVNIVDRIGVHAEVGEGHGLAGRVLVGVRVLSYHRCQATVGALLRGWGTRLHHVGGGEDDHEHRRPLRGGSHEPCNVETGWSTGDHCGWELSFSSSIWRKL